MKNTFKVIIKTAKSFYGGFKDETLLKVIRLLQAAIAMYKTRIENGELLKVSISKDNRKIGKVLNISIAPIITCGNMAKYCMRLCYDVKAVLQYPGTLLARARNTALAMYNPQEYFSQIRKALSARKAHFYCRWHVGGDILNSAYFAEMVQIAKEYPYYIFWTYTKKYAIVNDYISKNGTLPKNMIVMFSVWKTKDENGNIKIIPVDNPHNLPTFTIRFAEEEKPNMYKCPGNCDICKACNRGCIAGESTYNDAH